MEKSRSEIAKQPRELNVMSRAKKKIKTGVCILGAGPAGLGSAWELAASGWGKDVLVIDANSKAGGLARTEIFDGHRFDVGPHRFFTKNKEVDALWHEALGKDFRPVQRLTRIYYKKKFFLYPVSAFDALPKMGPVQAVQALASYAYAFVAKDASKAQTFEQWVTAKFGTRLYESFFKTYTEKVWGISCDEIGADWAAQRIKGLDLLEVAKNAFGVALGTKPKTLVDEFDYPALGAGQMYEAMAQRAQEKGVEFLFHSRVEKLRHKDGRVTELQVQTGDGPVLVTAEDFITTIPITRLLSALDPVVSGEVSRACEQLYYRDHITVNLIVDRSDLFPDQWIYVHSPQVRMARLANYSNFSEKMSAKAGMTPISIEYFVFRTDDLWSMDDAQLVDLASAEIEKMGLIPSGTVKQGWVVRETDSYPTYYLGYEQPYALVRGAIDGFENLHPAGRGGLYKYNNMDHSLYSGLLAARNLMQEGDPYDVWKINIDAQYHESGHRV